MARYKDAINWIVTMDDTEFINAGPGSHPSVSACLVADIFEKDINEVCKDIDVEMKRLQKQNRERLLRGFNK